METTIEVADASHVAETRRAVTLIGHSMNLSHDLVAQASLVTSELATNILKYAQRGSITVSTFEHAGPPFGLDVVAVDRGPGIANFDASLRDGFSTGGSLGLGLGTMQRSAALFDHYTLPQQGTAIFARLTSTARAPIEMPLFSVGARAVPIRGEHVSGDAWQVLPFGQSLAMTVVDGLGHGPKAAVAASAAVDRFRSAVRLQGPARTLHAAHEALRATRGAVMAVAVIDASASTVCFSGIGNIAGVVIGGNGPIRLTSSDGTVGYGSRMARESRYPWEPGSVIIMNSDGLSSKWSLQKHPGLTLCHPMLIAAVLHRDFARDTDDATVLVVKKAA